MTLETTKDARRRVARGRMLVLGAVVALACPACASKEKVATGPASGMGPGMAPPPLTSAFDPSGKQSATSSMANPWGNPSAGGSSLMR